MSDEEKKEQKGFLDPANYRGLCEPFPDADAAEKAFDAFFNDVYELRNKHRIADIHVIVRIPIEEHHVMTGFHCGDSSLGEAMTAWAYGFEQSARQANIARIVEEASRSVKRKPNRT